MKRSLPLLSTAACSAAAALPLFVGAPAYAATACADLAKLTLPETKITLAERVPAGEFRAPGVQQPLNVPALCRVAGTVSPAINFEVWLPEGATWNGRFQAVGGGGLAGIISYPAMAEAVRNGYASSSTDTGHVSTDTTWMADRQRVIDYGHRAIHEMTVKAKSVVEAHYGRTPEYSYFNGCSTGGRQPKAYTADEIDRRIEQRKLTELRYYNGETHEGVFALPNFVRDLVTPPRLKQQTRGRRLGVVRAAAK